ncbi:MAG: glycoside hydrolase family 3 C-terminal domain-containing protein [Clostridiales bacterium]|nr:glycoside hydrolase family 3 C-terminal domain-containing protein [Clostridiales bacterium]
MAEQKKKKKITVNDLTAAEKLRLLCGDGMWRTASLGGKLPVVVMSDGPVGLRTERVDETGKTIMLPAVAYPSTDVLCNTWNEDLARRTGEALSSDCADRGVDLLLAPGVNIKRDPLCGRNFEYYSEDPLLAGNMAGAYVAGLQESGTGACVKHFCCNNSEYNRLYQSSEVSERALRELYYKPFEIVCKSKPAAVMCAYNRVNGVYASENEKGFSVLRECFGFDGVVISDWCAVRDRTAAAKAGLDIEMPFSETHYKKLCADYENGKLSDEALNAAASRVLDFVYKLKERTDKRKVTRNEKERQTIAREVAAEGIVLLKNNGVLPLERDDNVAVCGSYAKPNSADYLTAGGSACIENRLTSFDLVRALDSRTRGKVTYDEAFGARACTFYGDARAAVLSGAKADVCIICAGTGRQIEGEGLDRETMRLPLVQERAILSAAAENTQTVVVLFAGAPVDVSPWEHEVGAIVYAGYLGDGGDEALAELLLGDRNFSGKLATSFPVFDEVSRIVDCTTVGVTRYEEELSVGYRGYAENGRGVLYPFGYGLSYARYEYDSLAVEAVGDLMAEVSYSLANVSHENGSEISQVYVHPVSPRVSRPERELKAYKKTEIAAGYEERVHVLLDKTAFSYYSTAKGQWQVDDGVYMIGVGENCKDIYLSACIVIEGGKIVSVAVEED